MSENTNNVKISSKFFTIVSVDALKIVLRETNSSDLQLLLVTSYGLIKGDLEEILTDEKLHASIEQSGAATYDLSYALFLKSKHFEELKAKDSTIEFNDNGAALNLKNVTLFKDNLREPILTINTMLVFVDQIVAVSVIPRDYT